MALIGVLLWVDLLRGGDDPQALDELEVNGPQQVLLERPAERGWLLTEGTPPRSAEDLYLREALELSYEDQDFTLTVGAGSEWNRWAVLWCELPQIPDLEVPRARLDFDGGHQVLIPCGGDQGMPEVELVPVPPRAPSVEKVTLTWEGPLPRSGDVHLAFYQEASRQMFPARESAPDRPAPAGTNFTAETSILEPLAMADLSPELRTHIQHVSVSSDSMITAWLAGPGRVQIRIDGVSVTDDGDRLEGGEGMGAELAAGPWQEQDPYLRGGWWHAYGSGSLRTFALPEQVRPAAGEQVVLPVEVIAQVRDAPWWVSVSEANLDDQPAATLTATTTALPHDEQGLIPVAQWQAPRDGRSHPLHLPEPLIDMAEELLFRARFDYPGQWCGELEQGWVTSTSHDRVALFPLTPAQSLTAGDAWYYDFAFFGQMQWVFPHALTATMPVATGAPPVTLTAYRRASFEEFDHAGAPPPWNSWPRDQEGDIHGEVVDRLTAADLEDSYGVLRITDPQETYVLRLFTSGAGRARATIEGRQAPILPVERDQEWWTPWTDQPLGFSTSPWVLNETQIGRAHV